MACDKCYKLTIGGVTASYRLSRRVGGNVWFNTYGARVDDATTIADLNSQINTPAKRATTEVLCGDCCDQAPSNTISEVAGSGVTVTENVDPVSGTIDYNLAVSPSPHNTVSKTAGTGSITENTNADGSKDYGITFPTIAYSTVTKASGDGTITTSTNADGSTNYGINFPAHYHTTISKVSGDGSISTTTNADGSKNYGITFPAVPATCDSYANMKPYVTDVQPNPNPTEKYLSSSSNYNSGFYDVIETRTTSRADLVALGMRPCDNCVMFEMRFSQELTAGAFAPPYLAEILTGMIVTGDDTGHSIRHTTVSSSRSENLTYGAYWLRVGAGGLTAEYTGRISNMTTGNATQVWGMDILGFFQSAN
jgi:hypothetical protein